MKIGLHFRKSLLLACTSVLLLFAVCANANNRDGDAYSVNAAPTAADNTVFAAEVSSPQPPALIELTHNVYPFISKEYDGNTSVEYIGGELIGVEVDDVVILNVEFKYNDEDVADANTISATTWNISGADAAKYTLPAFPDISGAVIKEKMLVNDIYVYPEKVYDGTVNANYSGEGLKGIIDGDEVSFNAGAVYNFKDVLAANKITISFSDLQGADAGNYSAPISNVEVEASITKRPISIAIAEETKTYGDLDPDSFTVGLAGGTLLAAGDLLSEVVANVTRDAGEDVGAYSFELDDGVKASNYEVSIGGNSEFTILPLPVILSAHAQLKTYGDVDSIFTYESVPKVGTELANGKIVSFEGKLSRDEGEDVGIYAINQNTLDNSSYDITYGTAGLTIEELAVTVTADAQTKTYGDFDEPFTYTSDAAVGTILANGDTITFSGELAREEGEDVGTYAITQNTLDNSNYNISFTSADINIEALPVDITSENNTKIYGDVDPLFVYNSFPAAGAVLENGEVVSFIQVLIRDIGEDVGSYTIIPNREANNNYDFTINEVALTITPLAVALVGENKIKTYGDVDPVLTYTSVPAVGTALANGEVIAFEGELSREAGEDVGSYAINQNILDNSNYEIAYTGAFFTIEALAVTLTADALSKTYGDLDPKLTYVSEPSVGKMLANGEEISFSGELVREGGEDVGDYAIDINTVGNSNYTISYTSTFFSVEAREIVITAEAKTKTFGDVDPAFTYIAEPAADSVLANGEVVSFTIEMSREAGEDVGKYAIESNIETSSNYSITYNSTDLSITELAIALTAEAQTKTYGDDDPILSYISEPALETVLANGEVIDFEVELAREAGEDVGTYAINNNSASNSNYSIAYVSADLTITRKDLIISAVSLTKTYGEANPELTYTYDGWAGEEAELVLESIPIVSTLANETSPVGIYDIVLANAIASNYNLIFANAVLEILPKELMVTADDKTKIYGEANPELTFSYSGWVLNEDVNVLDTIPSITTLADETSDAGIYDIEFTGGLDNNYSYTFVIAELEITKRELTVSADDSERAIDCASELTMSFEGFVNSDDANVLDVLPQLTTNAEISSALGTYDITVSGGEDNNYTFTNYQSAVLDVLADVDSDCIPNIYDDDNDNDGVLDVDEDVNGDGDFTNDDTDGDGTANYLDPDDDNDGVPTIKEYGGDADEDGIPNHLDPEDDRDGVVPLDEDIDNDGDPTNDYILGSELPAYQTSVAIVSKFNNTMLVCNNVQEFFVSYQWFKNGAVVGTDQELREPSGLSGTYYLVATTSGGLEVLSNELVFGSTKSAFTVYPNPVQSGSSVLAKIDGGVIDGGVITIFDINGRQLMMKENIGHENRIEINSLVGGIYFVRYSNGGTTIKTCKIRVID